MELRDLQEEHLRWMAHNFPRAEHWEPLVGAMEELGELAHAHLKGFNKIRGLTDEDLIYVKKRDAIGDVIIYLISYCNLQRIDIQQALELAWAEVKQRDWVKYPENGVTA